MYTLKPISYSLQPLLSLLLLLFLLTPSSISSSPSPSPLQNLLLPSDAVYLLAFKTKADPDNLLHYNLNEHFDYCQWQGVKCVHGRVARFGLQSLPLRGTFEPATLSRLDQLRILILRNNSLTGPVPDLSGLKNLKTLFLDRNFFSGFFPPSILLLHQILNLDLAHNNFTGLIPVEINRLDRVVSLRLESNRFSGSIPPLNQTTLTIFNVSGNNLTGPVPLTLTLKKFKYSSFKSNPNLCGDVVNKPCSSPFFNSSPEGGGAAAPTPLLQNARSERAENDLAQAPRKHRSKIGVVLGILIALLILIAAILSIFALIKRRGLRIESNKTSQSSSVSETSSDSPENFTNSTSSAKQIEKISIPPPRQLTGQAPRQLQVQVTHRQTEVVVKSGGDLRFCSGEAEIYSMEQLMRGSAELLGRGTLGTTYKAVMDNQLIVCVKRLDASKAESTSGEAFESHLEGVGVLRHPNLVPVRAYFQAKQERLIIYDYQPNGSLFNLIHGSRSTRAKPLHWTSCLKLAEDVAQGLVYIHQASGLVHGNLKSSNVLLGSDFEACLTDYCVSILATLSPNDDPDSAGYKAPEVLKSANRPTPKSDVYAFGVLLLELLSGKPPSQHPFLAPPDVADWVRVMRDDNSEEDKPLGLLVDVATICSLRSPEQRPTMRQVLKMIQDIKESAMVDSGSDDPYSAYS